MMNNTKETNKTHHHRTRAFIVGGGVFVLLVGIFFVIPKIFSSQHIAIFDAVENKIQEEVIDPIVASRRKFKASHVKTPDAVKAIYMTSWVAGTPSIREGLVQIIKDTEVNSVVIDIKDDTGRISFDVWDEALDAIGSEEIRIGDLREFIEELHKENIYVIGRISAFQDPYMTAHKPEWAVKKASDTSVVWTDRKGISWIDAGTKEMWDYLVAIGEESYKAGFDELNYDYVRFPSDGDMSDIYYPNSEQTVLADPDFGKADVIESFFAYLHEELKDSGAVLSADLFGMTTTNDDDLNIGQVLERALPYFDFIAPMVYPSHYPNTFIGLGNPAAYPYEVIDYSMEEAIKKVNALKSATTTPTWIREKVNPLQIRPWLQDFDLGAVYTPEMVRAQIQATYDNGLTSWMLWDAANTYTRGALLPN